MSRFLNEKYNTLAPYKPGEQPQNRLYIKLNTNESPFPPSPMVAKAVENEVDVLNLYSDPTCKTVIEALAHQFGLTIENVIVGNGSDEILAFCFQAFCEYGAAFADLTYGFYPVYTNLYGIDANVIPLAEDFTIHPQDYYGMEKTIFIANPNAPTGLLLSLAEIESIICSNQNNIVVIDEAYIDFGGESSAILLKKYSNLIVVGTFSKSRSLAGARLGYALASQELIADLNKIKFSFNPYNVNRMTLAAGTAALQDTDYFKNCCESIIKTREQVMGQLTQMGFICTNSKANFVFVKHPNHKGEELYLALKEKGILVRWFNQLKIEDYLRITIGTSRQMNILLETLKQITGFEG